MNKKIKILFLVLGILYLANSVLAAPYTLVEPVPFLQPAYDGPSAFLEYTRDLVRFLLGFAAVAAVVMIVIGGIQYASSIGNESMVTDAKDRIYWAILGLILALLSVLILRTINPALVDLELPIPALPAIKGGGQSGAGSGGKIGGVGSIPGALPPPAPPPPPGGTVQSGQMCIAPTQCTTGVCNIPSGQVIGVCK
ncbi:hypothetical protein HYT01_01705 [Candidatus Giovannonibacteria bacterium]|nr:hypothetical protein [Candidatus Giovannonibacteria bacterium]